MGVILGSGVVPIALCITWRKANKWGCISGAVIGFAAGLIAWLVTTAKLNNGIINVVVSCLSSLHGLPGLTYFLRQLEVITKCLLEISHLSSLVVLLHRPLLYWYGSVRVCLLSGSNITSVARRLWLVHYAPSQCARTVKEWSAIRRSRGCSWEREHRETDGHKRRVDFNSWNFN